MGLGARGLLVATALAVACAPARPAAHRPSEVGRGLARADAAFEAGDLERAAKLYDQAIADAMGPVDARTYARRAELFLRARDAEAGLAFVRRHADTRNWREPIIDDQKVALLVLAGQREQARSLARRVFAAEPGSYNSAFLLCTAGAGSHPCNAFLATRPPRLAEGDRLALIHRAYAFVAEGKADDAIATANQLKQRFPDDRLANHNADNTLCAALVRTGAFERAIATCEAILDHPDPKGSVHFNLCQAYLHTDRVELAREQAELYAARTPDPQRAAVLFEQLATIEGRSFEASQLHGRRGGPLDSGRAHNALARGEIGTADALARAHLRAYPWDSLGWQFLARVRWAQGRFLAAGAAWLIAEYPSLRDRLTDAARLADDQPDSAP